MDVPSVDPLDDKELAAHHQLFKHGIHILENVVLNHVADGDYELIALPLPYQMQTEVQFEQLLDQYK